MNNIMVRVTAKPGIFPNLWWGFIILTMMVFTAVDCRPGERTYIIKAGLSQNPNEPQVKAWEYFKLRVEKESGGRIEVRLYPNNQLGNQRDVLEGIQLGTIEASNVASVMAGFVPEVNIFELPFLFQNREHFYAALDSEIGQDLKPAFERRGFHLLGYFDAGVRHIMTVDQPVNTMADLKGKKIRTMENPLHLAAFKAFGASPLPMAYGEVYTALETGVIDGAEAAHTNYYSKKFYEAAPYWAQVGWVHLVEYVVLSRHFYQRLPAPLKKIVDAAAYDMVGRERIWYRREEEAARVKLEQAGVVFSFPPRADFQTASGLVYREWAERVGGMELIEKILNYSFQTTDKVRGRSRLGGDAEICRGVATVFPIDPFY